MYRPAGWVVLSRPQSHTTENEADPKTIPWGSGHGVLNWSTFFFAPPTFMHGMAVSRVRHAGPEMFATYSPTPGSTLAMLYFEIKNFWSVPCI